MSEKVTSLFPCALFLCRPHHMLESFWATLCQGLCCLKEALYLRVENTCLDMEKEAGEHLCAVSF